MRGEKERIEKECEKRRSASRELSLERVERSASRE